MDQCFLFLLNLAWESRYKLPLLVTVCFMLLDVRLQLEITVEARRIRRLRTPPFPNAPLYEDGGEQPEDDEWSQSGSNDSWTTIEETDVLPSNAETLTSDAL